MLPLVAQFPFTKQERNSLNVCIVQTALPTFEELTCEFERNTQSNRKKHRNHISAAIAAVRQMLDLRKSHLGTNYHLDWLIFPELSVHPRDVHTHLIPFARANKTIILAGLSYQQIYADLARINSAIWIIPEWTGEQSGLKVKTRRLGKRNVSHHEEEISVENSVHGIRPCHWLVGGCRGHLNQLPGNNTFGSLLPLCFRHHRFRPSFGSSQQIRCPSHTSFQ